MKRSTALDRRQHPRFPELFELRVREIQPLRSGAKSSKTVSGRVHNVSRGGICFISTEPVPQSSLVRCDITISEPPVSIPTLMQVRWIQKQRLQPDTYLAGLQFLF
ncbi:MAG TPA: PilZ domain-containing protein [Candidatus Sulfotelmatobacter sp.]|nr:PilZ domain-containing protein [Candidatus Sulfotelmatobacter sp.]